MSDFLEGTSYPRAISSRFVTQKKLLHPISVLLFFLSTLSATQIPFPPVFSEEVILFSSFFVSFLFALCLNSFVWSPTHCLFGDVHKHARLPLSFPPTPKINIPPPPLFSTPFCRLVPFSSLLISFMLTGKRHSLLLHRCFFLPPIHPTGTTPVAQPSSIWFR